MFKFLLGVAFGAAGYWAWQSFGRDLLGLSSDQDSYGTYNSNSSFSSGTGSSSYGTSTPAGTSSPASTTPTTPETTPTA